MGGGVTILWILFTKFRSFLIVGFSYSQKPQTDEKLYLFISEALLLREVRSSFQMSHHGVTIMKEHLQRKIHLIAVASVSVRVVWWGKIHLAGLAVEGPQSLLILPGDLWPLRW